MTTIWNDMEIDILKEKYPVTKIKDLLPFFTNKTANQINQKAKDLKLNKNFGFYKVWTTDETEFLKSNYADKKTEYILANLNNKTKDQIRWKAKEFKLSKKVTCSKKDLSFLEDLTIPENCYWWGMILADGCFTETQLILSLGLKDKDHLQIFANKINSKMNMVFKINDWNPDGYYMARVAANDRFIISRIRERFSISNKKTYTPFNIDEFMIKERLLYFLAGIIDGDGSVSITGNAINIKCHPNWLPKFEQISIALQNLFQIESKTKINRDGWMVFTIQGHENCRNLKKLLGTHCPLLMRKWERIKIPSQSSQNQIAEYDDGNCL